MIGIFDIPFLLTALTLLKISPVLQCAIKSMMHTFIPLILMKRSTFISNNNVIRQVSSRSFHPIQQSISMKPTKLLTSVSTLGYSGIANTTGNMQTDRCRKTTPVCTQQFDSSPCKNASLNVNNVSKCPVMTFLRLLWSLICLIYSLILKLLVIALETTDRLINTIICH